MSTKGEAGERERERRENLLWMFLLPPDVPGDSVENNWSHSKVSSVGSLTDNKSPSGQSLASFLPAHNLLPVNGLIAAQASHLGPSQHPSIP